MKKGPNYLPIRTRLKDGPVIFQAEEEISEENREKKDLTLAD